METSLMLDSGPILGLLNAFEKICNSEACEPFWDNESHSPRAKSAHRSPKPIALKVKPRPKRTGKKLQENLVSLWQAGNISLNSPVDWTGKKKKRLFLYYFSPSNQPSSPHSKSIDTSIMTLTANEMENIFSFYNQAVWSSG